MKKNTRKNFSLDLSFGFTAQQAIDLIRAKTITHQESNNYTWAVTNAVLPTRTGDMVYVECVVTDSDILYAIGPTLEGGLEQINVTSYRAACLLLEDYLVIEPEMVF